MNLTRSNLSDRWPGARCLTLLLALLPLLLTTAVSARELWVSPKGDDSNPGTRRRPLATLEAARDRLATAPAEPTTVWIRGGVHARASTFELGSAAGATQPPSVIYRAAPGESPVLLGGRPIRFAPLRESAIRDRLPAAARDHVLVADLAAQGITNLGRLVSRGFGRATQPAHLELFHGGRPMTLARWPNEGEWAHIAGFPEASAQPDGHGGKIGDLQAGFAVDGDRAARWQDRSDIWVHGYWAWDWANSYERIEAFEKDGLLRTAAPHGLYGFRKGQRLYFLNILEELDQPGEWHLDRATARLYFWPPPGTEKEPSVVSLLETPLVRMKDARGITLRGLVLEACRGTAIEISGGASNRVEACWIRNTGNGAVNIRGGSGHTVAACDIEDNGDSGVSMEGGDRQTLAPGGHRVENCHFQRQGRWSKCYVPAILMGGVGLTASHNLIHDHPHCAILFTGNEHLIEFNEIHHVALETGDVGAIYTGRDWTYRGNRILHNFIHDTGGVGMGSMGVYMDDCVSGTLIAGNIFRNVQRAAFLGGGRDHQVENNLFINCRPAVALDGRGLDRAPVWHNMVYQFMKERLADVPQDLYRRRYPAINSLDPHYQGDPGIPPAGNVVRRNIAVGGQWLDVTWHARQEMIELTDNTVSDQPGFMKVPPGDKREFTLEAGAPALQAGFQQIPFAQIGLQRNKARQEIEALRR